MGVDIEFWTLHFGVGLPLGIFLSNAGEWFIHKYVLHGLGRNKGSLWDFHWHLHHRQARKNGMVDQDYVNPAWGWNARTKEATSLLVGVILCLPLLGWIPGFASGVIFSIINYYFVHRRSHLDPEWARRRLPWHVDHHLGPNQDSNWCVTWPWFDHILGTREVYVGSQREASDAERLAKRGDSFGLTRMPHG